MPTLPKYITRYFWGDDLKTLSFPKHSTYITRTLMDKGDSRAIKWLFHKSDKKTIKKQISPKMNKKSINFWNIYLG